MAALNTSECFEFVVDIRGGKNLENRKIIGDNAPFVEITMGKESKKTLPASSLKDPNWNETLGFKFCKWEDIPCDIAIKVKDANMLLPSPTIGEYSIKLDKELLKEKPLFTIHNGLLTLENGNQAQLDIQVIFKYYTGSQFSETEEKSGAAKQMQSEKKSDDSQANKKNVKDETHVLSKLELKGKPVVLEKEVEFHKPVEVKEKIIHKEKPIIVEQPIIKEKYEQYNEQPEVKQNVETIVKESKHEQDVGNLDKKSLENLREQRQREFMDTKPVVQHSKEHVELDKEIRETPTKIDKTKVIYQQPVEINKTYVEKVIPKVHEDVNVVQEHVYQKLPPEMQKNDAEYILQDNRKQTDVASPSNEIKNQ